MWSEAALSKSHTPPLPDLVDVSSSFPILSALYCWVTTLACPLAAAEVDCWVLLDSFRCWDHSRFLRSLIAGQLRMMWPSELQAKHVVSVLVFLSMSLVSLFFWTLFEKFLAFWTLSTLCESLALELLSVRSLWCFMRFSSSNSFVLTFLGVWPSGLISIIRIIPSYWSSGSPIKKTMATTLSGNSSPHFPIFLTKSWILCLHRFGFLLFPAKQFPEE